MPSSQAESRFQQLSVQIHSSLWFVPACIIAGLVLLAMGLIELDRHVDEVLRQQWPQLFAMEAQGARNLVSTIAGSMATIAGVTFSMTMVALTLASQQYTSRVLRNFMRDRGNQIVLGIFIGIFLYCLLVLLVIKEQGVYFVPACAVLASVMLSALACAAFIYFIHHISSSIQADEMARSITRETLQIIDKYSASKAAESGRRPAQASGDVPSWHRVPSLQWGTIQTVAEHQLLEWACAHDAIVRIEHRPGDFVDMDQTLVSVVMDVLPDEDAIAALNGAFGYGAFRTLDQDPAFGVRQLVDMALKALSPGVNDSTTAVTCLDHLGVILAYSAQRDLGPPRHSNDKRGHLRLVSPSIGFTDLTAVAFSQIAESAQGNTAVLLRIFDTIGAVAHACEEKAGREALLRQAEVTGEIAMRSAKTQDAKEQLDARLRVLRDRLTHNATTGLQH